MNKKIIFFTGGVYSSIGKGITLSSFGRILKELGFKVSVLKLDPYLNVDSGLLSPTQHGEVFVTCDGGETDLDLGHYERFLDQEISKDSCVTAGKIYSYLLDKERSGGFDGRTVQVFPHLINQIIHVIEKLGKKEDSDFLLVEIGGTIGDIESQPFITAAKKMIFLHGRENAILVHIVPILKIKSTGELKTKPAQHSINCLLALGLTPDFLILKTDDQVGKKIKEKISTNTSISVEKIINSTFQENIYFIPNALFVEKIHEKILNHFKITSKNKTIKNWLKFTETIKSSKKHKLRLALVGKYTSASDAYISIVESFKFSSYELSVDLEIKLISSDDLQEKDLIGFDLICVAYGFGNRGAEGKIKAIKFARENKIPFLGICFALQLACIEYARNVKKIKDANSFEFDPETKSPICINVDKANQKMRTGNKSILIKEKTIAHNVYGKTIIERRHRHRFKFNEEYLSKLEDGNFEISAFSNDEAKCAEIVEIKNHPFFVAVQYHPEFSSRPMNNCELFNGVVKAAIKNKNK